MPLPNQTWLLPLVKGEWITVKKQNPSGWWDGEKESGKKGAFPGNHVKVSWQKHEIVVESEWQLCCDRIQGSCHLLYTTISNVKQIF
jgi:hypothetical protein